MSSSQERPPPNAEVITFGSNASSNLNMPPAEDKSNSPELTSSPDPNTKKENSRKSKKDKAKKEKKGKGTGKDED